MTLLLVLALQVGTADIIKLHQAGCGDDLILTFLGSKGTALNLSADDITALKAAGVSERVISTVLKGPVPAPAPEPRPILPPRIISPPPQVIYVEPAPIYYRHYDPWIYHDPFFHPHFSFDFGHHDYGHHGHHGGHHSSFSFGTHW